MASVIVVNKAASREVALENAVTVVGRDGGVGLELGDLQVSRRHALLVSAADGYFVKDLGSRNGVLLNKQKLASRHQALLRNGDVLSLGRTTLVFKDLGGDEAAESPVVSVAIQTVRNAQAARRAPEPEAPLNDALPIGDEPRAPVEPPSPPRERSPGKRKRHLAQSVADRPRDRIRRFREQWPQQPRRSTPAKQRCSHFEHCSNAPSATVASSETSR